MISCALVQLNTDYIVQLKLAAIVAVWGSCNVNRQGRMHLVSHKWNSDARDTWKREESSTHWMYIRRIWCPADGCVVKRGVTLIDGVGFPRLSASVKRCSQLVWEILHMQQHCLVLQLGQITLLAVCSQFVTCSWHSNHYAWRLRGRGANLITNTWI